MSRATTAARWAVWCALTLVFAMPGCADEGGDSDTDVALDTRGDATVFDAGQDAQDQGDSAVSDSDSREPDTRTPQDTGPIADVDPGGDDDGDTISNADEGGPFLRDTDGDGTPDYLDSDSDDDGFSDADEAGDDDPSTPPVDNDGDGVADAFDDDSDDNGVLDGAEGNADTDGDGTPDHLDADNDGDAISDVDEIEGGPADCDDNGMPDPAGIPAVPRDCDFDGTPDYMTPDSDGDTISDTTEGNRDTDGDGWLDRYDSDSDDDGYSDAEEAGDADLETPPVDTDGDFSPDYRDADSDADGLPDALELEAGTDRLDDDTDDDGANDLIEAAAGTDGTNPDDNPRARGDFVFVVPFEDDTTPARDTFEFDTSIRFADIYLAFDVTGTMFDELAAMRDTQNGLPAVIDALKCPSNGDTCSRDIDCPSDHICAPSGECVRDPLAGDVCIADIWTGVGTFHELNTFRNRLELQSSPTATANAIPGTQNGVDEAPIQVPACVADQVKCTNSDRDCVPGGIGCPAFRQKAFRILIQVTDADDQCTDQSNGADCGRFTTDSVGALLAAEKIRYIGLFGTDDDDDTTPQTPEDMLSDIGTAADSVDADGAPFVFPAVDSAVVSQTINAVRNIVVDIPFRITLGVVDEPGDGFDASRFIDHVEVNVSGQGACTAMVDGMPLQTEDADGDGIDDAFSSLYPGTPICFDVVPVAQNTIKAATLEPQMFRATLEVRGDGSPLSERAVFFLVPPRIPDLN